MKKCKCGRKLILDVDRLRGKCNRCVEQERKEKDVYRRAGRRRRKKEDE